MAADTITSRGPDARFLVAHPAHFIALGFGSGLARKAPGTVGTLAAFPLYWLLALVLPTLMPAAWVPLAITYLAIPLFFVGVWACDVTGRDLGVQDHGAMVWDEIVAFLPLLAVSSQSIWLQLVAFALFRLFDIWKPFPIRELERRVKGGMGVMVDDVFAAFYAYIAFAIFIIVVYKVFGYSG
jgi:phosphatidylglycerophosphatase A